ncbi:MAG TPA: dTMP kinase [Clostridia bacterium]|nr:dTMP kinase [Clostridia bacterium]
MAKFIVFEGMDGSGKTTQISRVAESLQNCGYKIVSTREPGGTRIGEKIREILLDPGNLELDERAEALLYAAARAQHVREIIRPALEAGKTVLCDRFCASTLAYQGYGRGIDLDFLQEVNQLATGGLTPDLTLLFDISPAEGLSRVHKFRDGDRLEQEHGGFYRKVRQGYLELAEEEGMRVIDAGNPLNEVYNKVYSIIKGIL